MEHDYQCYATSISQWFDIRNNVRYKISTVEHGGGKINIKIGWIEAIDFYHSSSSSSSSSSSIWLRLSQIPGDEYSQVLGKRGFRLIWAAKPPNNTESNRIKTECGYIKSFFDIGEAAAEAAAAEAVAPAAAAQ
ncbi:hypothetical protein M0804_012220 [Polistes exclamans]|nr:hypothetical protein M0804_012220 [Polistes exclamans]